MNKILLLSRYGPRGASSRVRSLQYLPCYRAHGIEVVVKPLLSDHYLGALYSGGSIWYEVLKGYIARIMVLFSVRRFDLLIIEKELFPFMPAVAERLLRFFGVRYVVDYDDALFHRYDCHSNAWIRRFLGTKIDSVMRHATTVIAGNNYLADRASRAGANKIEIVPSVVDVERYETRSGADGAATGEGRKTVGWIGTPETSRYLKWLLPALESLSKELPVRFVAVGASEEDFAGTPVEVWLWSEKTEVTSVQQFDIGIMPLPDTPWERGKCGYKLIQYMACGVPVVASAVGVNCEIVIPEKNGLLAESLNDWEAALRKLLSADSSVLQSMGQAGRTLTEEWYSLQVQAPRLLKILKEAGE